MSKVIEVYIRNEEVLTQSIVVRGVPGHPCSYAESYKSEKLVPETDRTALKVAEEVAKETGMELKVYNVSSIKGKMKASLKGVRNTPTIVVGKNKLEGVPEKE